VEKYSSPQTAAQRLSIADSALAWCVEYISTSRGVPPSEQRWNVQAGMARGTAEKKGAAPVQQMNKKYSVHCSQKNGVT